MAVSNKIIVPAYVGQGVKVAVQSVRVTATALGHARGAGDTAFAPGASRVLRWGDSRLVAFEEPPPRVRAMYGHPKGNVDQIRLLPSAPDDERFFRFVPVENRPVLLWADVVGLAKAIERGDGGKVAEFYARWGPLGFHQLEGARLHEVNGEPWGWLARVTAWFVALTSMARLAREGNSAQLRASLRAGGRRAGGKWSPPAVELPAPWEVPGQSPLREWDDEGVAEWRHKYIRRLSKREIRALVWGAVLGAVTDYMRQRVSLAVEQVTLAGRQPWLAWGFHVQTLLDVAVLQWYLLELGHDYRKCAREDCANPVPAGHSRWCSDRCRKTVEKRAQRQRKAAP